MEKKEIKSREPMELDDEMLDGVVGGVQLISQSLSKLSRLSGNPTRMSTASNILNIENAPSAGSGLQKSDITKRVRPGRASYSSDEEVPENEQQEP